MDISVYDTSVGSLNSGDQIIMKSVNDILQEIFKQSHIINFPTHQSLTQSTLRRIRKNKHIFIGGTNLLSPYIGIRAKRNQLKLGLIDALKFNNNVILLGVGSSNFNHKPNAITRLYYGKLLSKSFLHSVRDKKTKDFLKSIGYHNVVNTCCPTTWDINFKKIKCNKTSSVLITITDYKKDPIKDREMINIISNNYKDIYFWKQGSNDLEYLNTISTDKVFNAINIIPPSLTSLDNFLKKYSNNLNYIGTRLHAGIYCMNMGFKTYIVGVDERARNISSEVGLPLIERSKIENLENLINSDYIINCRIPIDKISEWKNQFYKTT